MDIRTPFIILIYISDLLFPLWWIVLMVFCMKKGLAAWKAWGLASSFCVAQAYLVAKYIGWNLGGYFLILITSTFYVLSDKLQNREHIYYAELDVWFWIVPSIILIVIPMVGLFLTSRVRK